MAPAQDFLLTTPVRRTPSPVLPGAWPLSTNTPNNMHKRSSTCPTLFEPSNIFASSAYSNSLHLEHVRNFHQRLSLSLSRSPGPSEICNTTTTFLPSEYTSSSLSPNALGSPLSGSDLTCSTQNNTNTPFLTLDTSANTTYKAGSQNPISLKSPQFESSPTQPDLNAHGLPYAPPSNQPHFYISDSPPNDDQVPSPLSTSLYSSSYTHTTTVPTQTPLLDLPHLFHTPSQSTPSSPTVPSISPILFSSPIICGDTSSPLLHHPNHAIPLEYLSSPSWEALYKCGSDDEDMLWIDTPPATRPPSFSRNYTSNTVQHDHTPSLDMDLQAIPMLTALSLPGSVNSSYSCLIDPNIQYVPQTDEETWVHSLTSPPLLEILPKISPGSHPRLISLSSTVSKNQHEVGLPELSSPPTPQSPSSIAVPPPPENIITPLTDAAEYAAALMTSVWGGREDQIAILVPTEYGIPNLDVQHKADGAAQSVIRNRTYTNNDRAATRPTKGFMDIFKKFGTRIKKIMQGLPHNTRTRLNTNVARSRIPLRGHSPRLPVGIEDPTAAYLPNSQLNSESPRINQCNQRRLSLPAPPGLLSRLENPHLSTVAQTSGSLLPGRFPDAVDGDPTHPPATQTPPLKPNRTRYFQSNRLEIKETRIEARPELLERMRSSRHRLSLPTKLQPSRSSSATNSTLDAMIQPRLQPVTMGDSS